MERLRAVNVLRVVEVNHDRTGGENELAALLYFRCVVWSSVKLL